MNLHQLTVYKSDELSDASFITVKKQIIEK